MQNGLKNYFLKCDELPIYNWQKALEGDLTYLRKSDEGSEENDALAWVDFLTDYYEVVGLSDHQERLLDLQERYVLALLDYVEAPDEQKAFLSNELNWSKDALDKFTNDRKQNDGVKSSILESVVKLENLFKRPIDEYKTTVLKFHLMCKEADKMVR
jgi:hypothetical protein